MRMRENASAYTDSKRIESTKILPGLKIPLACFLAVYALTGTAAVARGEQQKNDGAITEILAVLHAQQDAWNRDDIHDFMSGYARSGVTTLISNVSARLACETRTCAYFNQR